MWHLLNDSLSDICSSAFWDSNITWYSVDPDFTICFEKTILVWLPCMFLWFFFPLEMYFLRCSKKAYDIPFNRFNIGKLAIIVMLGTSALIDATNNALLKEKDELVDILVPPIRLFTFILFFGLTYANIKRGIRSSGILFGFSLILALCTAVQFRTELRSRSNTFKLAGGSDSINETTTDEILELISNLIYYPSTLLMFFLNCFADPWPAATAKLRDENICPENDSSLLSKISFSWFDSFVWKGHKRPLNDEDLWDVDNELKMERISRRFEKRWNLALDRSERSTHITRPKVAVEEEEILETGANQNPAITNKNVSILRPICETFGPYTMIGFLWKFLHDILAYASPLLLKLIINFAEEKNEHSWHGIFYAVLLVVVSTLQSLLMNQHGNMMVRSGLQIQTALRSIVYKKALKISNGARKTFTLGQVTNLMAVDASSFRELMFYLPLLWAAPLNFCIASYFLSRLLGLSVLALLVMFLILIPANYVIASMLQKKKVQQMKYQDERIKLINEILSGIKVVKLNAWEPSFQKRVSQIRQKEIAILKSLAYLQSISSFVWSAAPFLVFLVTFGVYVLSSEKNTLDPEVAFVSLALFNILRYPLSMIPTLVARMTQVNVSIKRINKYLNAEELSPDAVSHEACLDPVIIEDGQFSWDSYEGPSNTLSNINLRVKSGSLVAVVGPVGSGKSSLLHAILGEMYKQCGFVNTNGTLAYVPQQAWIRNATLKDNITFGVTENHSSYTKILEACALNDDLKCLPDQDETEIGEKGVNLSGGQKQRVSLARAIYANADIYLLDDPLSAVDSHVGKHIFEEVVGPTGFLKDKTRIWVTHNLTHLPKVDNIIVLQDGTISEQGTYKELLELKGDFADFLTTHQKGDDSTSAAKEICNTDQSQLVPPEKVLEDKSGKKVGQKLIKDEKVATGSVNWSVYMYYLKAVGLFLLVVTLCTHVMYQIFSIATNYWLSIWSSDTTKSENDEKNFYKQCTYLGVYASFGFLEALSVTIMSIALYMGLLKASNHLHNGLLSSVLHWPATTFDKIPLGRIINRFSFDINILDDILPDNVAQTLIHIAMLSTTLLVITYTTPLFMIVVPPLGAFYVFVQRFFIDTSRQLKRLESASKSPIYSHTEETVTGAQSIRAYGLQSKFIKLSEEKVDYNQRSTYMSFISRRWLAVRLEFLSNMIVFFSALFAVMARDSLSAGIIALSISYALQINFKIYPLIRMISEFETNIVAIERIKEYEDVEQEAAWETSEKNTPTEWPSRGEVVFENFQVRYREGLELVLKGISFSVKSGEKIGIVGRTGSGKSSLTLSLFRVIESAGGRILIDGIDISMIGLHTLRSRLTIIPQDPVLFSGTLRINLDPTEEHSDENLWRALELANLKTFVTNLDSGLQYEVTEGGSNFSVGQRQLICLARAVLRKTKLLVLDEATAAVDMETDDFIQTTIRKEFQDCTILTVAHRLNTVLDYDRIMVLDNGKIVEFDSPSLLLESKQSLFYSMVADAGLI